MPSQNVLINLRIPSLTVRAPGEPPKRVDNAEVRFRRTFQFPAIAKPGEVLDIAVAEGEPPLKCTVNTVNWDEREGMFVVACYAKAPMPETTYRALLASSDWVMKSLL